MTESRGIPALPAVSVTVVSDQTPRAKSADDFLYVRQLTMVNRYDDGSESRSYRYDVLERRAVDAVVILAYQRLANALHVVLRSALRPPIAMRKDYALPIADPTPQPVIWEVPAGLVEADERGEEGLRQCAARETFEEVGLRVDPAAFRPLGPAFFLAPGALAERIYPFAIEVDYGSRVAPPGDGHPVEEGASLALVSLDDALTGCRDGRIQDAKTEVLLRRFAEGWAS